MSPVRQHLGQHAPMQLKLFDLSDKIWRRSAAHIQDVGL
jgi:hypothetical protein